MVGKALTLLTRLGDYPDRARSPRARPAGRLPAEHRPPAAGRVGPRRVRGLRPRHQALPARPAGLPARPDVLQAQRVHRAGPAGAGEVSAATQEATLLAVRDGERQLYVYSIEGPQQVRVVGEAGQHGPLHCTSQGKVLVAFARAFGARVPLENLPLDPARSQGDHQPEPLPQGDRPRSASAVARPPTRSTRPASVRSACRWATDACRRRRAGHRRPRLPDDHRGAGRAPAHAQPGRPLARRGDAPRRLASSRRSRSVQPALAQRLTRVVAWRCASSRPSPTRRCVTLPWHLPLEEWGDDVVVPLPRGISRHVVRIVRLGPGRLRRQADPRARWPTASTACCATCGASACRRSSRSAWSAAARPTTARRSSRRWSPGTCSTPCRTASLFSHGLRADSLPQDPRRARRAARAAAPGRLLLGRRVAVERAVPAQRRRVRGVPRRRRDRRAARRRSPTASAAHDLEVALTNIYGELLDLQAGGLLERGLRRRRHRGRCRGAVRRAVGRAHRHRGVHHRRDVAHRAAHRAAQRPRLRRRRARHRHRLGRRHGAHAAQGRRGRPPRSASCSG